MNVSGSASHARLRRTRRSCWVDPATRRLRLAPLSVGAVAELAPFGVDADELHRHTGGNPFFVVEVLAAGGTTMPETIRDAVLARVARLDDEACELLAAVAIVPQPVERWLLHQLAGDRIDEFDACVAAGILTSVGTHTSFRHELSRRAVAEAMPPGRRTELHRRALRALADPPSGTRDFARLAYHAEAAGDVDAVRRFAPAAGQRAAALGSHREAAAQYARVLRFGDVLSAEERADLLAAQAASCFLADLYDDGIAALEQEAELRRGFGDRRGEGDALRRLSEFLYCPGRTGEARRAAEDAVRILEALPPSPELGHAYCQLCLSHDVAGEPKEAVVWGERAVHLAEELGARRLLADGRTHLAVASSDVPALLAEADLAIADGDASRAARALVWIGFSAHAQRQHDVTRDALARGIALCSERGFELYRLYLLALRARHELVHGRWDDAVHSAQAVLRVPRTSTTPRVLSLVVDALVHARRGDAPASPLLDEAWALAEPTGEPGRIDPVVAARVELDWLEGRIEEMPFDDPDGPYETAVAAGDVERLLALGAVRTAEVIAQSRGGRGPRRSTLRNPAGLTVRQLEVLPLLVAGLSNREIATRLVVSERTVEHHVTAIFRKLDVRTRAEATAHAVRAGIVS